MNFDSVYDGRRARNLLGSRVNHIVPDSLARAARCGVSVHMAAVAHRGRLCKRCQALEARAQAALA